MPPAAQCRLAPGEQHVTAFPVVTAGAQDPAEAAEEGLLEACPVDIPGGGPRGPVPRPCPAPPGMGPAGPQGPVWAYGLPQLTAPGGNSTAWRAPASMLWELSYIHSMAATTD